MRPTQLQPDKPVRPNLYLACLTLAAFAGCGSAPELLPPGKSIPKDIDLSGQWQLTTPADMPSSAPAVGGLIIPRDGRKPVVAASPAEKGSSARLFLESGENLKLTQSESALFISFDRSIVEEYRFGVLREVSIGPITAQRATGWEGDTLVVRTLDEDGAMMTERWRLDPDSGMLERRIDLRHRDKEIMSARQLFARRR